MEGGQGQRPFIGTIALRAEASAPKPAHGTRVSDYIIHPGHSSFQTWLKQPFDLQLLPAEGKLPLCAAASLEPFLLSIVGISLLGLVAEGRGERFSGICQHGLWNTTGAELTHLFANEHPNCMEGPVLSAVLIYFQWGDGQQSLLNGISYCRLAAGSGARKRAGKGVWSEG